MERFSVIALGGTSWLSSCMVEACLCKLNLPEPFLRAVTAHVHTLVLCKSRVMHGSVIFLYQQFVDVQWHPLQSRLAVHMRLGM